MEGGMNEKELKEFLSQRLLARIATVDENCRPHVAPVWFLFEDGKIFITTGKNSVKVRNIMANPEIAITVDETEDGLDNRGVIMKGKAELVDDEDIPRKIFIKYLGSLDHPSAERLLEMERITISLRPEKIISWDFRER